MNYSVICETGSDTSYDLIIEAISPVPPQGVIVEALNQEQRERADAILSALGDLVSQTRAAPACGLRFRLFQRTPDLWVWAARLEALRAKLRMAQAA